MASLEEISVMSGLVDQSGPTVDQDQEKASLDTRASISHGDSPNGYQHVGNLGKLGASQGEKRKRRISDPFIPAKQSKKETNSLAAADPAAPSSPSTTLQSAAEIVVVQTVKESPTALPSFEWLEVSHPPEIFLLRLQLRSFLLLFGELAPPAINPKKLSWIQRKVLANINLTWTLQELGKVMQIVLSIVGDELADLLSKRHGWDSGTVKTKKALLTELMRKGFTDDSWEYFYDFLYGVGPEAPRAKKAAAIRGRSRGRSVGARHRNRKPNAQDSQIKYELLRQVMVIGASCTKIKKRLQNMEAAEKQNLNATKTAEKALKAELKGLCTELRQHKESKEPQMEAIENLASKVGETQDKIAKLSLTRWLCMRKLDPRSSHPIGADPLGNVYYIVPHDEELAGYASWVICQKGPELNHPLGVEWREKVGDGGNNKSFYAIDGSQEIAVLSRWIWAKSQEKAMIDSEYAGSVLARDCDVLVEKLQQFCGTLSLNSVQRCCMQEA